MATASPACLVLMFKAPERSKRRLADEIGAAADAVAGRLLDCALEDTAAWPGPVCYAPAEPADGNWLATRIAGDRMLVPQGSGNLGRRINRVNEALVDRGFERQLFIGIDCPALSPSLLAEADAMLDAADIVLVPAADGGVVLMGARRLWPDLEALPWSEASLLDALVALCRRQGLTLAQTGMLRDVDSLADLQAMAPALAADERAARRALLALIETDAARAASDRAR